MLHILPLELLGIIIETLEPINILNLDSTCKQLAHNTRDRTLWTPYLLPILKQTISDPKTAFFDNIEHCLPCFWHLHPKGIIPYQELKTIVTSTTLGHVQKIQLINQNTTSQDEIKIIMALVHPEFRELFARKDFWWNQFFYIFNLIRKHNKALLFFLRDPYYQETCLSFYALNKRLFAQFKILALIHQVISFGTHWEGTFEALLDHIVNTLEKQRDTQAYSSCVLKS